MSNDLGQKIAELRDGKASWAQVTEETGVPSGKAQFLLMQYRVEENPKLKIKYRNDDDLADKIKKARAARDAHSSWGWIAARSGQPESKIKQIAGNIGILQDRLKERSAPAPASKVTSIKKNEGKPTRVKKGKVVRKARKADPSLAS